MRQSSGFATYLTLKYHFMKTNKLSEGTGYSAPVLELSEIISEKGFAASDPYGTAVFMAPDYSEGENIY